MSGSYGLYVSLFSVLLAALSSGAEHLPRVVSRFELRFNDTTPLLPGSNVRDDDSASSADLTDSKTSAWMIRTEEDLMIARHTWRLIGESKKRND
ncbi:MAG: hypothetical protein WAM77_12020 [Xanthobacteraceae bacterium]